MFRASVAALLFAVCSVCQGTAGGIDTFSAVVVEYSPPIDPSVDPQTNILKNVAKYVELIQKASDVMADIIIFPEEGLKGYSNQEVAVEVPDPKDMVRPCAENTTYEAPLVQLSCAARAQKMYIVVNLVEKYYNETLQSIVHFNTDVAFDRNGAIIARYRKIHLYGENGKQSPPDKELVFFDTDFGVRFGLLTCFDIIFEDPGVTLAKKYNITHFIFPTGWFSQMPFLTAVQEQMYWSYTLDVILLASGYNLPSSGSSGSGIYLGKQGAMTYAMIETRGSFMLHANVPKQLHSSVSSSGSSNTKQKQFNEEYEGSMIWNETISTGKLKLKVEDFLSNYTSELITIPENAQRIFNGSDIIIPFTQVKTICQNDFCCNYSIAISLVFGRNKPNITRGDDFSGLYYRLAVFNGVRHYDYVATGGLQTCAIIPCATKDLVSCGLRSDDESAEPNMLLHSYQTRFIFESIKISGNFSNNNSFVGPNLLMGGQVNSFYGSIFPPDSFNFHENITDISNIATFQTIKPIERLVTGSLYGRLFNRDGQNFTGGNSTKSSGACAFINTGMILIGLIVILQVSSAIQ